MTGRRFDVALKDALSSTIGSALDHKAYYCAGRSAYELGLYEKAMCHFEKALEFNPRDTKYIKEFSRTKVGIPSGPLILCYANLWHTRLGYRNKRKGYTTLSSWENRSPIIMFISITQILSKIPQYNVRSEKAVVCLLQSLSNEEI